MWSIDSTFHESRERTYGFEASCEAAMDAFSRCWSEVGRREGWRMINKRGQSPGTQRGNRQRFPYEPRVVGGKLMMPAELQAIHRYVVETPVLETVTDEIRAVVETVWPELISKLQTQVLICPSSYVRPSCRRRLRLLGGRAARIPFAFPATERSQGLRNCPLWRCAGCRSLRAQPILLPSQGVGCNLVRPG
jgi:hypothetical protein